MIETVNARHPGSPRVDRCLICTARCSGHCAACSGRVPCLATDIDPRSPPRGPAQFRHNTSSEQIHCVRLATGFHSTPFSRRSPLADHRMHPKPAADGDAPDIKRHLAPWRS